MILYDELAEHYFAIESHHRNFAKDIEFIRSFIPPGKVSSILDIGCGTGEHIENFAREGYRCVGIDASPQMLDAAKKRGSGKVDYQLNTLAEFDFFEEFDLIMSLFGSMDYVLSDKDFDNVLWNIWRALKPEGIALLEIWNSFPVLQIGEKNLGFVSKTQSGNLTIDRERGFKVLHRDPVIVEVLYRYHLREGINMKMLEDKHMMRAFSLDEFELLAAKNGFTIHSMFSNSSREEFKKYSNKILVALKK
jgi:SAM-dependent methyltransferase